MSDTFWMNLRYALIAVGSSLLMRAFGDYLSPDQAASLLTPLVDLIVGGLAMFGAWIWGNVVKWGTKTFTAQTASRSDVPTVSPATGAIEK